MGQVGRSPAGRRASYLEQSFLLWMKQEQIPWPLLEYEFALSVGVKCRFDFAWPKERFAVEIDGLTKRGGGHQRTGGYIQDRIKDRLAMLMDWQVYRIPGPWVATKKGHVWKTAVAHDIRLMLKRRQNRQVVHFESNVHLT